MIRIAKDGRRFTPEVRDKIGKRVKNRIAKEGHPWKGRYHKESSKEKMKGKRPSAKYNLASYYRGTRVYCSKLDMVFFSIQHCADYLGIRTGAVSSGLKRHYNKDTQYKTLSYYKEDNGKISKSRSS